MILGSSDDPKRKKRRISRGGAESVEEGKSILLIELGRAHATRLEGLPAGRPTFLPPVGGFSTPWAPRLRVNLSIFYYLSSSPSVSFPDFLMIIRPLLLRQIKRKML